MLLSELVDYQIEYREQVDEAALLSGGAPGAPTCDLRITITEAKRLHLFRMETDQIEMPGGIRVCEVYGLLVGDTEGASRSSAYGLVDGCSFIVRNVERNAGWLNRALDFIAGCCVLPVPDDAIAQRLDKLLSQTETEKRLARQYVQDMLGKLETMNAFLRDGRRAYKLVFHSKHSSQVMDALGDWDAGLSSLDTSDSRMRTAMVWISPHKVPEFLKQLNSVILSWERG